MIFEGGEEEEEEEEEEGEGGAALRQHHAVLRGGQGRARMAASASFLEELKEQQQQKQRQRHDRNNDNDNSNSSSSTSDAPAAPHVRSPTTTAVVSTNLFVGNLCPAVTEEVLGQTFAEFGDVYSTKIMWPRTAEAHARQRHSGFVCFRTREAAERAMRCSQGRELQGFRMRLDWGKPVKMSMAAPASHPEREQRKARQREQEQAQEEQEHLSEEDTQRLRALLRDVTIQRPSIARVLLFALDAACASADVVQVFKDSLTATSTPAPVKVARLYVVADVLHNCGAPVRNATTYRTLLQDVLPEVFDSFNRLLRAETTGRMTANRLEEAVLNVLRTLAAWGIYPTSYLAGLEATFLRRNADVEHIRLPQDSVLHGLDGNKLRRRAHLCGLFAPPSASTADMFRLVRYYVAFVQRKAEGLLPAGCTSAAVSLLNGREEVGRDDSDDDGSGLDGEPLR